MEGGGLKPGLKFALLVLLVVFIGAPAVKIAAEKIGWLPEGTKNWIKMA